MNADWEASWRRWLRAAVAFTGSAEPRARISRRAIVADVILAALVMAASLVAASRAGHSFSLTGGLNLGDIRRQLLSPLGEPGGDIPWSALALAVITSAPLAARRVLPLTAFWVILLPILATSHASVVAHLAPYAAIFAAYSAVVYSRYRGATLLSLPVAAVLITAAFPNTAPPLPGRATALAILIPLTIVGNAIHVWKRRAGDSQARIRSLQAEHEAATRRAVELERAHIASELHDVVTHNVSVMVVQAGAARQVLADSPQDARQAMLAVESSGRAALTELRHLLGLLSPSGPPGSPDAAGAEVTGAAQALRPQPGIGQLQSLIDRVTAAGLPAELTVTGEPCGLPPGVDLAAYRVVQEALTNVIKHAGQARTEVRLDYHENLLTIEIADSGPPAGAESSARAGAADRVTRAGDPDRVGRAAPGTGRGLLGLRERVGLYGGELDAGRRPGGGWRVRAWIPLDQCQTPAAPQARASARADQTAQPDAPAAAGQA